MGDAPAGTVPWPSCRAALQTSAVWWRGQGADVRGAVPVVPAGARARCTRGREGDVAGLCPQLAHPSQVRPEPTKPEGQGPGHRNQPSRVSDFARPTEQSAVSAAGRSPDTPPVHAPAAVPAPTRARGHNWRPSTSHRRGGDRPPTPNGSARAKWRGPSKDRATVPAVATRDSKTEPSHTTARPRPRGARPAKAVLTGGTRTMPGPVQPTKPRAAALPQRQGHRCPSRSARANRRHSHRPRCPAIITGHLAECPGHVLRRVLPPVSRPSSPGTWPSVPAMCFAMCSPMLTIVFPRA